MTNKISEILRSYPEAAKNGRNFSWNTLGLAANSINSLLFLIIVTRISGISNSGIFSLCYANSIVFYNFALYGVRAYQVTDVENDYSCGEYVAARIVTSVAAILLAVAFVVLNRYDPYKSGVALFLIAAKICEAFSDVYHGILQKNERIDLAGKANFLKSASGFVIFLLILLFTRLLLAACLSLVVINLATLIFYEQTWVSKIEKPRLNFNIKKISPLLVACFSVFAVSVLSLYVLNTPRYAIDKVMSPASQGVYGIISMPGTTISLFTAFLIQFFLSIFAKYFVKRDWSGFCRIIITLIMLIAAASLLFEVFCYYWGIQLLKLLYGTDLSPYLIPLLMIIAGVSLLSMASVFCSALTTMRYMKVQLFIFLGDTVTAIFISPMLVRHWGIFGAAAAFDIIASFQLTATCVALTVGIKISRNFNKGSEKCADSVHHYPDL